VAIIDLGSNTARVVVMSAIPGYAYRLEDEIREVVRLRQGMTDEGLAAEAMKRGFATLRLFKRFCDGVGAASGLGDPKSPCLDDGRSASHGNHRRCARSPHRLCRG